MLRNPCVLRGPHQRGQNQKWLPHPCLSGGPHKGICYVTPAFWGIPIKGDKNGLHRVVIRKMPRGVVLKGGPEEKTILVPLGAP